MVRQVSVRKMRIPVDSPAMKRLREEEKATESTAGSLDGWMDGLVFMFAECSLQGYSLPRIRMKLEAVISDCCGC